MSANGSKLEKAVGEHLRLLEKAGELRDVREQVRVQVCCGDPECRRAMAIHLIPDFSAFDVKLGKTVYFEAKGFETPEYRIKRRLWMHYGAGPLRVFQGTYKKFSMTEEINPKGTNQ